MAHPWHQSRGPEFGFRTNPRGSVNYEEKNFPVAIAPDAKFLVVRRDNIGDLVCTTPLIRLLREHFPDRHIAALVNSYNKSVLAGNGDLDVVYHYSKAKHVKGKRSSIGVYLERIKLIWCLRRQKFDFVILANSVYQRSALNIVKFVGARHVVGYAPASGLPRIIDIPLYDKPGEVVHEVDAVNRLLAPFGIGGQSPPAKVYPDEKITARMRSALALTDHDRVVGIHISARTAQGRWPIENFRSLIKQIAELGGSRILLFWSPGNATDAHYPGDDLAAMNILSDCHGLPIQACPTAELEELVAGLSLCQTVICCDGGAMHIAAALEKTVIALFGNDPARWHPWQTNHVVLRAPSGLASDITVGEVAEAFGRLCRHALA